MDLQIYLKYIKNIHMHIYKHAPAQQQRPIQRGQQQVQGQARELEHHNPARLGTGQPTTTGPHNNGQFSEDNNKFKGKHERLSWNTTTRRGLEQDNPHQGHTQLTT